MIFRRFYWFILLLLISCSFYGDQRLSFKYVPAIYRQKGSYQINETIAITPFQDLRGDKIIDNSYHYLPLVLWTNFEADRPEKIHPFFIIRPREDTPKAIQEEFQSHGIFKDILITERKNHIKSEYYIEGKIISTNKKGKRILYGLSFLGVYAFWAGLPLRVIDYELSIELILIESKTKRHLLKKEYKENTEHWYWFGNLDETSKADERYNTMAKKLIPEMVDECITVIKNTKGLK